MKKENFTADRVKEFQCATGKQQSIFWDAKTPGLGLRVTSSGSKSYIFETRLHGKTMRRTIGDERTWTVKQAQSEATRLKGDTDKGIDPREQAAEQKAAAEAKQAEANRQIATLGDAWSQYVEENKDAWGARHYADHVELSAAGGEKKKRGNGLTIAGPLASLLPLKLSELTSETLAAWLQKESKARPARAALAYRLLRAFIRWTHGKKEYKGLIEADAYSSKDVRKAVPKGQTKDDCLQVEQLSHWFAAVRKIENRTISAFLQSLLISGARREELQGLEWVDVDFKWLTITIRDKVDGFRVIPLPPFMASLLLDLKRLNETPPNVEKLKKSGKKKTKWEPSRWVFSSSTSESGRLEEPSIAHIKAVTEAGLPHLTLHGLRRSFGTLCEWVEVPAGISAQIMGHKPSATAEKHYRVRPVDMLRMWHVKIEAWILEQAGIEFTQAQPGLRVVA